MLGGMISYVMMGFITGSHEVFLYGLDGKIAFDAPSLLLSPGTTANSVANMIPQFLKDDRRGFRARTFGRDMASRARISGTRSIVTCSILR